MLSRGLLFRYFPTISGLGGGHRRTGKATLGRLVNSPLLVNPPVIPGRDASARAPLRRKRKKSYGRHESRIILGNRPR